MSIAIETQGLESAHEFQILSARTVPRHLQQNRRSGVPGKNWLAFSENWSQANWLWQYSTALAAFGLVALAFENLTAADPSDMLIPASFLFRAAQSFHSDPSRPARRGLHAGAIPKRSRLRGRTDRRLLRRHVGFVRGKELGPQAYIGSCQCELMTS